ncbi:alpha/beta fold hydrolase [Legionella busanensis]|nr:alpha/beta hydrolase [Legionella busanensis]
MRKEGAQVAIKQLNALIHCGIKFDHLKEIRCPTLLIRGDQDSSINIIRQEQMLMEIPSTNLSIISDSAHYVPLQAPTSLASTIEKWLEW